MNNTLAKKIAETITNEELQEMFASAKASIKDWTARSSVNKGMTKGTAWNILAKDFDVTRKYHALAKKNMIWEFGDFLPAHLMPQKVSRKSLPNTVHQEPIFS